MSALSIGLFTLLVPLSATPARPPAAASVCRADAVPSRVVQVRMYSRSRLAEQRLLAMLDTTNRVWLPYDLRVEPGTGRGAIVVVVSDAPIGDAKLGPIALGTTLFENGHAMASIGLSLGAADALASTMNMMPPFESRPPEDRDAIVLRMLGVALAHEIAHYLLDTPRHSQVGLLRPVIGARELQSVQLSHLGLTDDQRRLMCLWHPRVRGDD